MKWQRYLVFLLVIAMMFSLAACGNGGKKTPDDKNDDSTGENNNGENSELVPQSKDIIAWWWFTDTENALVNEFVRENPDFTIDNSVGVEGVFGDRTLDLPKLAGVIASDDKVPDVFFSFVTPTEAYYTDMFLPLQKYIDIDPEFKIDEFDDQAFSMTTFNDMIYFLPFDYTSHVMGWNRELFEEVGLDPDTPPKTWSEYLQYCEKLTTYTTSGQLKTIGAYQDHFRWEIWQISASGENYVDKTGLKFNWDTPDFLKTMEFARDIAKTYGGAEKLGDAWWWIVFGNVGMGDLSAGGLSALAQSVDVGLSRIPRPDDRQDEFYAASYLDSFVGITRNGKNPAGAWKYIKWAVTEGRISEQMQIYEADANAFIPTYIPHAPTREKLYSAFEPFLTEERLQFVKDRDKLVEECNRAFFRPAENNKIQAYFSENYKKMLNFEMAPQDFLRNMQTFSEQVTEDFIKAKEGEGWIFEDGKDGIPPSMQENQ